MVWVNWGGPLAVRVKDLHQEYPLFTLLTFSYFFVLLAKNLENAHNVQKSRSDTFPNRKYFPKIHFFFSKESTKKHEKYDKVSANAKPWQNLEEEVESFTAQRIS